MSDAPHAPNAPMGPSTIYGFGFDIVVIPNAARRALPHCIVHQRAAGDYRVMRLVAATQTDDTSSNQRPMLDKLASTYTSLVVMAQGADGWWGAYA